MTTLFTGSFVKPIDRLQVFVSSTIGECAAERKVVREAIRSINFEPVLFEDVGARPYPPREVYIPRLETAQIFVGIYRLSYGWVAPEMTISGLEDEFQVAAERGIDRLIYVFNDDGSRDPRLQRLVDTAMNAGLTVAFYSDPSELRQRVRDDITAVVSTRFVEQAVVSEDVRGPSELLSLLLPNPHHRIRRLAVESTVLERLAETGRLAISAPLGSGKTILLAQLAADHNWTFVEGEGLTRLDLLARITNALRNQLNQPPISLSDESVAEQMLLQSWAAFGERTLAVDAAVDPNWLWQLPRNDSHLLITARAELEVPVTERLELGSWSSDEVSWLIAALRGSAPPEGELRRLLQLSGGNPLYLRFYALGEARTADVSLQDLEIRAFHGLSPRAREIVSYLTLSRSALSLTDLMELVGGDGGPEAVAEALSEAKVLVKHGRGRAELIHEHPRTTLLRQLQESTTRLAYFSNRLGTYWERLGNYVGAFHVYIAAGEDRHADRILIPAAHQAGVRGGGAIAIPIFRRMAEKARESGALPQQVRALLSLSHALRQTGARREAAEVIAHAHSIADHDKKLALQIAETELMLDVPERTASERIERLEAIRGSYIALDHGFDGARITTYLTAEYISGGDYTRAELHAREALRYFSSIGDEFGVRVSRLNLAAALSGLSGREDEASEIVESLNVSLDPEEHPRERAVICNILTRRYRKIGNTDLAAQFAHEAIDIGTQLGDLHVVALNRINLGNVRRDEGMLAAALEEYRAGDVAAVEGGLKRDEAAANELIASVLNELGDHELALHHARHGAGTARSAGDPVLFARSSEELAHALSATRQFIEAADTYVEAARAIQGIRLQDELYISLITDGLRVSVEADRPSLKARVLAGIFLSDGHVFEENQEAHTVDILLKTVSEIVNTIPPATVLALVAFAVSGLMDGYPPTLRRRVVRRLVASVLDMPADAPRESILSALAGILLASPTDSLQLGDLVDFAEQTVGESSQLSFKGFPDGAAHWTIRVNLADPVVVTISQMDDRPRTFSTTMVLSLLLAGLADAIKHAVIDTESLPRREFAIQVVSRRDFEENIEPEIASLGTMPDRFGIFESSDVTRRDQPPGIIVLDDKFGEPWDPGKESVSDVHSLFAELLRVFTSHILAQEVEPSILYPKISALIRTIRFR